MDWSGSQPDTHNSAVLYFRIIMGCMLFNIISLVINAAQRGAGDTRISMRTSLTANVVNMVGNYLLIQGNLGFPKLGIAGAAIATVIGTIVVCSMSIASLFRKEGFLSIPFFIKSKCGITLQSVKVVGKLAGSAFIEQLLLRVGFTAVAVMADQFLRLILTAARFYSGKWAKVKI